jgi:hypothetical protein
LRWGTSTPAPDTQARALHLNRSHVDSIEPCRKCWARYLCGGGCHHEVKARGRVGCDYIRGWLAFCLKAYVELGAHFAQAEARANLPGLDQRHSRANESYSGNHWKSERAHAEAP